jgi:hypothetical protein
MDLIALILEIVGPFNLKELDAVAGLNISRIGPASTAIIDQVNVVAVVDVEEIPGAILQCPPKYSHDTEILGGPRVITCIAVVFVDVRGPAVRAFPMVTIDSIPRGTKNRRRSMIVDTIIGAGSIPARVAPTIIERIRSCILNINAFDIVVRAASDVNGV